MDKFLGWQADIVNEYRREDQFVTHNLDFEWRGYSYGIHPYVNHLHASQCLTIAGTDIYRVHGKIEEIEYDIYGKDFKIIVIRLYAN